MNKIIPLDTIYTTEIGLVNTKAEKWLQSTFTNTIPADEKDRDWLKSTFIQTSLVDSAYIKLANNYVFNILLLVNLASLFTELVLISYDFETSYIAQIIVLAFSTLNFIILLIFPIYILKQDNPKCNYIYHGIASESLMEIFFLIIGWVALGLHSPLASFRGLRIIRYLWYSEYYTVTKNNSILYFYVIFYSHLLLQYVDNIRIEIFTTKTKGALGVIALYFFLCYIYAVIYTHATRNLPLISPEGGISGDVSQCDTLSHCYFIMIKIAGWDGNGFDFWKSLLFHHSRLANFLGVMLGFFIFVMDFIILNGILGIFAGNVFATVAQEDIKNSIIVEKLNTLLNINQQQQVSIV